MVSTIEQILEQLQSQANPQKVAGMARYGINPHNTLGISIWDFRRLASQYRTDHQLAQALWSSGIHEARLLAAFIDDPTQVPAHSRSARWIARDALREFTSPAVQKKLAKMANSASKSGLGRKEFTNLDYN